MKIVATVKCGRCANGSFSTDNPSSENPLLKCSCGNSFHRSSVEEMLRGQPRAPISVTVHVEYPE